MADVEEAAKAPRLLEVGPGFSPECAALQGRLYAHAGEKGLVMILKSLSATGAAFTPMPGNLLRRLTLLAAIAGPVVFGLSNVPRISAPISSYRRSSAAVFRGCLDQAEVVRGISTVASCFCPAG